MVRRVAFMALSRILLVLAIFGSFVLGLLALPDRPEVGFGGFWERFMVGQILIWCGYLLLRYGVSALLERRRLEPARRGRDKSNRASFH